MSENCLKLMEKTNFWVFPAFFVFPSFFLIRAGDRLRRSYKHKYRRIESEQTVKIRALRLFPSKTKQTKQIITYS